MLRNHGKLRPVIHAVVLSNTRFSDDGDPPSSEIALATEGTVSEESGGVTQSFSEECGRITHDFPSAYCLGICRDNASTHSSGQKMYQCGAMTHTKAT